MIKIRNQGDQVITLYNRGTQTTTGANATAVGDIVAFPGIIKAVFARLGTAGVTGTQTVDLKVNGTAISSNPFLSFATTSNSPTYDTTDLTTNPPVVAKGDILSIVNATVHSGTAALDLIVDVVIERFVGTGFPSGIQTDTYGLDSDAI